MIVNDALYQSLPTVNYDKPLKNNEPVPKEVLKYYTEHGYGEKMIPLNAKTANEILEILKNEDRDNNNAKYYPKEPKKINSPIDELTVKVMVEKVDILNEMEVLNKRMREAAVKNCNSEEKIKAYDIGVENTMSALESLINPRGENKDRLIYQKYGEQCDVVQYRLLVDVLKELRESGQLHLAKDNSEEIGGDKPCQTQ